MRSSIALFTLAAAVTAPIQSARAEATYEALATELARLRTDVETISARIDDKKAATHAQLRGIAAQKMSLEAEVQREDLRLQQLAQGLADVQRRIQAAGELQRSLKPAVLAAIAEVKRPIVTGLPFRIEDRVAEMDRLRRDLEDDVTTPSLAVSRLWTFVEDELRLTRETGLYQQVISVSGDEMLADVARVGMVMMYFRTKDGRYGYVRNDAGRWVYVFYANIDDGARAATLFESLEKRVRVGFFELPNAVALEVSP